MFISKFVSMNCAIVHIFASAYTDIYNYGQFSAKSSRIGILGASGCNLSSVSIDISKRRIRDPQLPIVHAPSLY